MYKVTPTPYAQTTNSFSISLRSQVALLRPVLLRLTHIGAAVLVSSAEDSSGVRPSRHSPEPSQQTSTRFACRAGGLERRSRGRVAQAKRKSCCSLPQTLSSLFAHLTLLPP